MTYRKEYFFKIDETFKSHVSLGNNQTLSVQDKGSVKIQKLINGEWSSGVINNVLYVPDLRKNLFSEGVITNNGMGVTKISKEAKVYENSKRAAVAIKDNNNTYKMLFRTVLHNAYVASEDNLRLWHERLGHINMKYLQEMIKMNLVKGISGKNIENIICEPYLLGKQQRKAFKTKVNEHKHHLLQITYNRCSGVVGAIDGAHISIKVAAYNLI